MVVVVGVEVEKVEMDQGKVMVMAAVLVEAQVAAAWEEAVVVVEEVVKEGMVMVVALVLAWA